MVAHPRPKISWVPPGVTQLIKLYNFSNIWSRSITQIVLESLSEEQDWYKQKVWDSWRFWFVPRELKKSELFSQEIYHSQNFGYETLKSLRLKKTKCVPLTSFRVKFTNDQRYIFVIFTHQRMNEYKWIYDWTLMLLKDFREPLLSFELIYFRNFFCYKIEIIEALVIKF